VAIHNLLWEKEKLPVDFLRQSPPVDGRIKKQRIVERRLAETLGSCLRLSGACLQGSSSEKSIGYVVGARIPVNYAKKGMFEK
jgi:hypothetical protein